MTGLHAVVLSGDGIGPLVAGGKGSALDKLIALDAKVPATGVVTTAGYREFEAIEEIVHFVDELRRTDVPDPSEHQAARERVDDAFLSVALPGIVSAEVDALALTVADGGLVAIRSSATAEDLATASFAGQYESYLNVAADGIHDAVRKVWASLWYPAPRAYRRFRSIDEADLTMAVVVMRMLHPSHAGVLFTVDPGGNDDSVRLEVVEGLGEQLVSGEKTPDAYVIPRSSIRDQFAAISPPLGDLADEALRLEAALEAPQDIEFAVHEGELYLVQARPITTLPDLNRTDDGFDFSCGHDTTYTTAGIAEMLPGVLSPLSWTINSWLVENGFRTLFDVLGGEADVLTHEHALIGRFRGRAALNLDAMRAAAGSIPGGSADELEKQYFGEALPGSDERPSQPSAAAMSKGASAAQGVKVLRARREAAEQSEVAIQAVANLLESEPDVSSLSDHELLGYWNRALHLAQRVVATEVTVAAMASAAYRSVEVFLTRYMSEVEAAAAVQALTSQDGTDRRSRIALALEPVIETIRADPALVAAATEDWETAMANLVAANGGSEVLDKFSRLLRRAGSTALFAGPTWDEVPNLAWMTVHQELIDPSVPKADLVRDDARQDVLAKLTREPRWRWSRFVTGQLMDVRRRFLVREAADAAEFLQRREHTKAAVLILGGVIRRANLEIGRRLTARGNLESPDDVEMLSVGEIPMLTGASGPNHEELANRRRRNLEAEQSGPLPHVWTGEPEENEVTAADGERFEGWSASPGRYEGIARIVDSAATSKLRRGEVLIATTTDASWAPLFMAAGAVVVEQGGPLSHAAIVARELGMPAVANVPGLIARIRREDRDVAVVVDGSAGTVTILCDGRSEPAASADTQVALTPTASAGVAPLRAPSKSWDDTNGNLNVFVAGLVGAGALMSVIIGLTESISSRRGRERLNRQAHPLAAMMASGVVDGYEEVARSNVGLRPRRHYQLIAVALAVVAGALFASSLDSYASEATGSVVAWAISLSGTMSLAAIAGVFGVAAVQYPDVPPIVRTLAPGRPARSASIWALVPPRARLLIYAMLGVVLVLGVIVVAFEDVLLDLDERIYFDWLEAGEDVDRWGPQWLNLLGRPEWVIPLSVLIGIATLRCRVVSIAYPTAIVIGGLANLTISWATHRLRPPLSVHAGEFTSFPGGHSLQLPLLLGMLPLAAYILSGRKSVRNTTAAVALGVWAVAWADTIRTGGHWPSDQLAGLLIALSLLMVVYSVAMSSTTHESCVAGKNPDD